MIRKYSYSTPRILVYLIISSVLGIAFKSYVLFALSILILLNFVFHRFVFSKYYLISYYSVVPINWLKIKCPYEDVLSIQFVERTASEDPRRIRILRSGNNFVAKHLYSEITYRSLEDIDELLDVFIENKISFEFLVDLKKGKMTKIYNEIFNYLIDRRARITNGVSFSRKIKAFEK